MVSRSRKLYLLGLFLERFSVGHETCRMEVLCDRDRYRDYKPKLSGCPVA